MEETNSSPPKGANRRAFSAGPMPHLSREDVRRIGIVALDLSKRHGLEYRNFVDVTFDTALRVNEVLVLRPMDIDLDNGPMVRVSRE